MFIHCTYVFFPLSPFQLLSGRFLYEGLTLTACVFVCVLCAHVPLPDSTSTTTTSTDGHISRFSRYRPKRFSTHFRLSGQICDRPQFPDYNGHVVSKLANRPVSAAAAAFGGHPRRLMRSYHDVSCCCWCTAPTAAQDSGAGRDRN